MEKQIEVQNVALVAFDDLVKLQNQIANSFNTLILKQEVLEAKIDKLEATK